jgi:excisionase family DNA binding protein
MQKPEINLILTGVRVKKGHPNHRLVKKHRNYTVYEAAFVLGVHKNTVREWIRRGLPTTDDNRPFLIRGCELIDFLHKRRAKKRRPCRAGQMYCFRCKVPQFPAGGMTDFTPISSTLVNLIGLCPSCNGIMHRCVGAAKLQEMRRTMDAASSEPLLHLNEISEPSLNSDLG